MKSYSQNMLDVALERIVAKLDEGKTTHEISEILKMDVRIVEGLIEKFRLRIE